METQKNNFYIYGASGHGKVVLDTALLCNRLVSGFIDDNPAITVFEGYAVVHTLSRKREYLIAIGNNNIRRDIAIRVMDSLVKPLVHPSAIIAKTSKIGIGTLIAANVVINPNSFIGINSIINTAAVVEHDCIIEDHVHISPNATLCGAVTIGMGAHVGAAAVILPGVKVGAWCTVGAGAVVLSDVPDGATIVGNPAHIIKQR